ncbi:RHS repeat domain-containing protein [Paenibacillus silvae]|uniref:RHS repeat domain-containing protein n=1 Tax=Paenibacillus silvae TaxID=1325358 RepID=UPI003CEF093B
MLLKEENKQYTYDTLKRLRSGAEPGRIVHYTYDPSGNLTSEQVGTSPTENPGSLLTQQQLHYTWDNRLQRLGDYPVEMDANGNLLYATDGSTASAYEYDARNRLVKAGKLKYRYNPQGDRIELAQRGQVTRYVIDDAPELSRVLMELDGEGNVKARYVYGLGLIGREDADGTYLSYHYDLRGSTTLLTDEQNRVKDRYTYGLYGELEQHEGVTVQPFAYNGRDGVMTDANGLYYMRARYYDPKLKRFLNRDVIRGEIQDRQTFNRYAYVNGNPVSYIDPLGLMKCETEGTGNGLETRGYKPQPGERTFDGYVKNNVPVDKETTLHTHSKGFNNNSRGSNPEGQFKRYGSDSHAGLSPHVHQPTRNVNKNGEIFGGQGSKTQGCGVIRPNKKDVGQLYDYLNNGKYRK